MLHTSFAPYLQQQRLFSRYIKILFGGAGCFWIVIYGFQTMAWIDHETLKTLRNGQTMIYFILLTLWGLEYMREVRRLKLLIAVAEESHCSVGALQPSQIASYGSAFSIISPLSSAVAARVFSLVNLVGLVVASILIILRYIAAIQSL